MISSTEEIKSRVNIVDLIGEYIRLNKAGVNWKACCPFHNEKTPSFVVSEEKQIWHCFGCQKGGDIFGFLMEIEGIEFKEALRKLAEKAGIKLPEYRKEFSEKKSKTLEILELATKFYEKQLWDGAGKEKILKYLHERGLKDETIKEFRLGYAPSGWRNLLTFLLKREYETEEIVKTGLLVEKTNSQISNSPNYSNSPNEIPNSNTQDSLKTINYQLKTTNYYDRFRDRIIFPIADVIGKVVGFSARVAPGEDESQAKYVNTPETEVYHKSRVLYGIDKAKREIKNKNFVLLVEGNTDVIAASQAGIKNVVAVSGTALTSDQLDILKRYTENVKMFFDMDSAGTLATRRSAEICFQKDINVFIVKSAVGKDAAEIANKNPQALLDATNRAVSAAEYFFDRIMTANDKTTAEGKKIIAKEILNLIRNFENEIERSHWIKKLGRELEVEEKTLLDVLRKVESKRTGKRFGGEDTEKNKMPFRNRAEIMREKIIGLMLTQRAILEKLANFNDQDVNCFLREDELFTALLEKGLETEFRYENFIANLENEETRKRALKTYFEAKYQFGSQEEVEEKSLENANEMLEQYLGYLKKEMCKVKLKNIAQDLRKAETSGDKEAAKFLMAEFSKISRELK
jgi:DNA primase